MKRIIIFIIVSFFVSQLKAQMPVTDATTQVNQIIIAKSQMLQTTDHIITALNSLGVSTQTLENIHKQAERLKKINATIKTIKKTTEILELSYKITRLYSNLSRAITADDAFNSKQASLFVANMYSILGGSLDLVADVTNIVTDNVFQMTDKERIDYIENVHTKLRDNFYKMQYNAYRIATYSSRTTTAERTLADFNTFFNF